MKSKKSYLAKVRKQRSLLDQIKTVERISDKGDEARMDAVKFKTIFGYSPLRPRLSRPMPGAQVTVRQLVQGSSFNTHTGLSGDRIVSPQTVDLAGALAFSLNDLSQSSTLAAFWDQYRIEAIRLFLVASISQVTFSTTATAPPAFPPMAVVVDYDDSNVLASFAAAMQYDNVQLLAPYQSVECTLIPKFAPTIWNSGAASGFSTKASIDEWIDVASPSVPMYGIKYYVPADGSATGHQSWTVFAEYTVSFKNVH